MSEQSPLFEGHRPLAELIEDFELLDDWEDRYAYLIDLGKRIQGLPDELKQEVNLVRGCTSQVWLVHQVREGASGDEIIDLAADSDAFIVRGLVAILLSAYSGKTRAEIGAINLQELFGQIGLERNLSVSRRNGFASMIARVQTWAKG